MKIAKTRSELRDAIAQQNIPINFIPTMGALHTGHLSLVKQAAQHKGINVVSIFVNPRQFNNTEDFNKYPLQIEQDIELLSTSPCDVLFIPDYNTVYAGAEIPPYDLGHLDAIMEGSQRPGHFKGVAEVIARLFDLVQPDRAFFGEKDFQQLAVIKHLVQQWNLPIEIIGCPIVRNEKGLAMSSRNARLSKDGIELASSIHSTLEQVKNSNWTASQTTSLTTAKNDLIAKGFDVEYITICDAQHLSPYPSFANNQQRVFVAAHLEGVRLIDNLALN